MTIKIKGVGFDTVGEAMQHWYASGADSVMTIGNKYVVTSKAEAERVAATRRRRRRAGTTWGVRCRL